MKISADQLPPIFAIGLSSAIERRGQFRPKLPFPANVMLPLPFFSLSPRIAAAATFLCFNNPALTQLYITLCHSLTLVVHHRVSVQSCQLTSSNHQPVPAKTGTAAHSGGEEGLVEGWVVGISILLAGGFFAGKQSGI